MSIKQKLTDDIKTAMRTKDKVALTTIRALKTAITNVEKNEVKELTDPEVISIIRKQVKQRLDSIAQFQQAGRKELMAIEQGEINVLETYLPSALSEDQVSKIVQEAVKESEAESMKDMGKVMKICQEKCQGRADGKLLSQLVKSSLS